MQGGHKKKPLRMGAAFCVWVDSALSGGLAFFDTGALAAEAAQVEEFGAAHVAVLDHLDLVDVRGVEGERAFHAHAVADLAHSETGADACTAAADAHALELLDALLVAFDDFNVNVDGVARPEFRIVGAHKFGFDEFNQIFH